MCATIRTGEIVSLQKKILKILRRAAVFGSTMGPIICSMSLKVFNIDFAERKKIAFVLLSRKNFFFFLLHNIFGDMHGCGSPDEVRKLLRREGGVPHMKIIADKTH